MVKGSFLLKVSITDIPELVHALIQRSEELKLTKEDKYAIVEAKGLDMDESLSSRLAILYPDAEVRIILDGRKESFHPELPDILKGILNCPNPNCVTSQPREPAIPEFLVVSRRPLLLLCAFCGRYIPQEKITPSLFDVTKKLPL